MKRVCKWLTPKVMRMLSCEFHVTTKKTNYSHMKKNILIIFIILTSTTIFAQQNQVDTIYLKNGIRVQGNVVEFNFPIKIEIADGSVLTFSMNEIEKIIKTGKVFVYSTNDVKEIINEEPIVEQQTIIPSYFQEEEVKIYSLQEEEVETYFLREEEVEKRFFRNAFGLDLGVGTIGAIKQFNNIPSINIGIRYIYNFSQYFGMDFVKVNYEHGQKRGRIVEAPNIHKFETAGYTPEHITYNNYWVYCFQIMTGLRGNTPAFYKYLSGYGAFRSGYGASLGWVDYTALPFYSDDISLAAIGFCFELEVGVNLTRNISVGYAYNYQHCNLPISSNTLRFSFNFGK